MFERELDYYGIVLSDAVSAQKSLPEVMKMFVHGRIKHDMFFLALEYHNQFSNHQLNNPTETLVSTNVIINKDHKLYDKGYLGSTEREWFDTYLERYFGLKVPVKAMCIGMAIISQSRSKRRGQPIEIECFLNGTQEYYEYLEIY